MRKLVIKAILMCLSLNMACAREQSKEDRDREKRDRAIERLKHAEGAFSGTVKTRNGDLVPLALVISINRNPTDGSDQPVLAAKARLGLFGGVDLATDNASYDYGSKRFTATFSSGDEKQARKELELQATIDDGEVSEALFLASTGTRYPVSIKDDAQLSLAEPVLELLYAVRITESGQKPVEAVLSLTRRTGDQAATASSDMPRFPELLAAVRFPQAGHVAHTAAAVSYDVLADQVDIDFAGGNGLRLSFRKMSQQTPVSPGLSLTFNSRVTLNGDVEIGKRVVGTIAPSPDPERTINLVNQNPRPFRNYVGKQLTPDGDPMTLVANMAYLGSEDSSKGAMPFDLFPKTRLNVTYCTGEESHPGPRFVLTARDYLRGEMTFAKEPTPTQRANLRYDDSWTKLQGYIVNTKNEGAGGAPSPIELNFVNDSDEVITCQTKPKVVQ
jgi:hypothetical protein